jgi:uncharacterized protein (TIGR03083 family)
LVSPRYEGPPIISIAGAPDDQLAPLVRQRRRLHAMLATLDDDDWRAASRCAEWTVQDVVAHIVGVNAFWRASVLAGLAGTPTRVLVGFDPATTPDRMVAPMRALAPGEVLDQLATSNDAFLDVMGELDDRGWATLAESPAGHVPIRVIAHHALWDCWVHERDIALPLGSIPPAEPDEVVSCLRFAAALGPSFAIGAGRTLDGVFAIEADDPTVRLVLDLGQSVTVRDDASGSGGLCLRGDAVALVEALSLRVPLPPSTPSQWLRLVDELATAFDVNERDNA